MFSNALAHEAKSEGAQTTKQATPMKATIRLILLLSMAAAVLGLSACQSSQSKADEMPRMNHLGLRVNRP